METLWAVWWPAVNSVRERGRRLVCSANLKEVSTALASFESQNQCYPPGVTTCTDPSAQPDGLNPPSQGPNWLSRLLPNIDDQATYDQLLNCVDLNYNPCTDCTQDDTSSPPKWFAVGTKSPGVFRCPTADLIDPSNYLMDSQDKLNGLAKGNIAGNFGKDYYAGHTGMFDVVTLTARALVKSKDPSALGKWKAGGKGVRNADIRDGANNTVMLAEILGKNSPDDLRGAWFLPNMGASSFTGLLPPNAVAVDQAPPGWPTGGGKATNYYDTIQLCDTSIPTTQNNRLYCGKSKTGSPADSNNPGSFYAAARSAHPGGVNVATAGHNVIFVADTIEPEVWQCLCTKDGKSAGKQPELNATFPE